MLDAETGALLDGNPGCSWVQWGTAEILVLPAAAQDSALADDTEPGAA